MVLFGLWGIPASHVIIEEVDSQSIYHFKYQKQVLSVSLVCTCDNNMSFRE